jgi:photosystem I P700 chlorophyll a apoprotein A1
MMNHHLAGLLGLGCLSWVIKFILHYQLIMDAGVAPQEIPLPHVFN